MTASDLAAAEPAIPPATPVHHFSAADQVAMAEALHWATQAIGLTEPNPRVGCVITNAAGRVLGAGHTQQAGGPHAEVMAMRAAQAAGHALEGATVYVTLEPCAHHGRTPPCADALVAAKVGRVVAAVLDPNPLVAGKGLARLQAAGIAVAHGLMAEASQALNIGFFSRMVRGRPWVRLKVAASVDGFTALPNGVSQWITSQPARADGHAWRRRAGAVLTGIGTVLADDPRLDVRWVPTAKQPARVVLDARLDTPLQAKLLQASGTEADTGTVISAPTTPDAAVHLLCSAAALDSPRATALRAVGEHIQLHAIPTDAQGRLDLPAVLERLGQLGVNELHVEAGQRLNGAWVAADLVDEYLLYLAPTLLGQGRALAAWGPLSTLAQARHLQFTEVQTVGPDVRLLARPQTPRWSALYKTTPTL